MGFPRALKTSPLIARLRTCPPWKGGVSCSCGLAAGPAKMSNTCLVCNTIHLEMIGILRHQNKLDYMLKCLLGVEPKQDDYLCNKCCNDVINTFDSKQTCQQFSLFEPKEHNSDRAVVKYEVGQGDQSENAVFADVSEVKFEPKSEGLEDDTEDVTDGTIDINYDEMMSGLVSIGSSQWGAVEEYRPTAKRSVMAIAGDKHGEDYTRLNKTESSWRLFQVDFNIESWLAGCKQIDWREQSKRHESVDIDDSTVETKSIEEREDVTDISFTYAKSRSRPNRRKIQNSHTSNRPANEQPYVCCKCERSFITLSKLKIHQRTHIGRKSYKCCKYEKNFTRLDKLKDHERTHIREKKPHKCCECERSFTSSSRLKEHKNIHIAEKSHKCSQCERSFINSFKLKIHERKHTGERPFKCCECGKSYSSSRGLKAHEKIHTGEKSHKCSECEKSFLTTSQLKIHERNHTGERPYKCCQCEKSFVTSSHLKLHERTHTGERPYKCNECEKSFTRPSIFTVHQRIHTGEKPYKCGQCEKSFNRSDTLKIHEFTLHTGEKPYKCSQCEKSFVRPDKLRFHERTHTGQKS